MNISFELWRDFMFTFYSRESAYVEDHGEYWSLHTPEDLLNWNMYFSSRRTPEKLGGEYYTYILQAQDRDCFVRAVHLQLSQARLHPSTKKSFDKYNFVKED